MTANNRSFCPYLANDDQLMSAVAHQVVEGPAAGTRVLVMKLAGGFEGRVLLDRGLDIGSVWFAGQPIAWMSPSGERKPGYGDQAEGWHRGWAGGLLTTCGLRHVGAPGDGFGRHGMYADCPAEQVSITRQDGCWIQVQARIRETDGLDRGLVMLRRIRWYLGEGRLRVRDRLINETSGCLPAPIVYHINLGYPFLGPSSRTTMHGLQAGDGFTDKMGTPQHVADEIVRHQALAQAGTASIKLTSPKLGLNLKLAWKLAEMDHTYTWRRREPGYYVQAIEPTNADLFGTAIRHMPVIGAGETRLTGFDLRVRQSRTIRERKA